MVIKLRKKGSGDFFVTLFIIAIIWGVVGMYVTSNIGVTCTTRVSVLCFTWEKNFFGQMEDFYNMQPNSMKKNIDYTLDVMSNPRQYVNNMLKEADSEYENEEIANPLVKTNIIYLAEEPQETTTTEHIIVELNTEDVAEETNEPTIEADNLGPYGDCETKCEQDCQFQSLAMESYKIENRECICECRNSECDEQDCEDYCSSIGKEFINSEASTGEYICWCTESRSMNILPLCC